MPPYDRFKEKPRHVTASAHVLATRLAQNSAERVTIGNTPLHALHLCDAQYLAPLLASCASLKTITIHLKYVASSVALEVFLRSAAKCRSLTDISVMGGLTPMEAAAIAAGLSSFAWDLHSADAYGKVKPSQQQKWIAKPSRVSGLTPSPGPRTLEQRCIPFSGDGHRKTPLRRGELRCVASARSPTSVESLAPSLYSAQLRCTRAVRERRSTPPSPVSALPPSAPRRIPWRHRAGGGALRLAPFSPPPSNHSSSQRDAPSHRRQVSRPLTPVLLSPTLGGIHVTFELHRLEEETAAMLLDAVRAALRIVSVEVRLCVTSGGARRLGQKMAQEMREIASQHRNERSIGSPCALGHFYTPANSRLVDGGPQSGQQPSCRIPSAFRTPPPPLLSYKVVSPRHAVPSLRNQRAHQSLDSRPRRGERQAGDVKRTPPPAAPPHRFPHSTAHQGPWPRFSPTTPSSSPHPRGRTALVDARPSQPRTPMEGVAHQSLYDGGLALPSVRDEFRCRGRYSSSLRERSASCSSESSAPESVTCSYAYDRRQHNAGHDAGDSTGRRQEIPAQRSAHPATFDDRNNEGMDEFPSSPSLADPQRAPGARASRDAEPLQRSQTPKGEGRRDSPLWASRWSSRSPSPLPRPPPKQVAPSAHEAMRKREQAQDTHPGHSSLLPRAPASSEVRPITPVNQRHLYPLVTAPAAEPPVSPPPSDDLFVHGHRPRRPSEHHQAAIHPRTSSPPETHSRPRRSQRRSAASPTRSSMRCSCFVCRPLQCCSAAAESPLRSLHQHNLETAILSAAAASARAMLLRPPLPSPRTAQSPSRCAQGSLAPTDPSPHESQDEQSARRREKGGDRLTPQLNSAVTSLNGITPPRMDPRGSQQAQSDVTSQAATPSSASSSQDVKPSAPFDRPYTAAENDPTPQRAKRRLSSVARSSLARAHGESRLRVAHTQLPAPQSGSHHSQSCLEDQFCDRSESDDLGFVVYPTSISFLRARVAEINRHVVWHQVKAAAAVELYSKQVAELEEALADHVTAELTDILMVITDMEHGSPLKYR